MIIINQDKTVMLNYENIEAIGVAQKTKDKFKIIAATVTNNEIEIAEYKTEERAKEVLQEIYCKYEHGIHLLSSKSLSVQNILDYDFIYEMPKE